MKQQPSEEDIKESEELQKQVEDWKSKALRALADYQNLEKRSANEAREIRLYAGETILRQILPITDTLFRAQVHLNDQGLGLALKELEVFLVNQGVEKIETINQDFDPTAMECIEVVEGPENKVIEELLPGYKLFDKLLRVAQVKVGKKIIN